MSPLRRQIDGREFDWFAVDSMGHVAHFSSAGFGPIPRQVLARLEEADDLPLRLLALPIIGSAKGHMAGRIDDWLEMAKRGLYSFDWSSNRYQLAATPSVALHTSALPAEWSTAWPVVRLRSVVFAQWQQFDPELYWECD